MKKILVLLTVFSMVFTSCEPLEMINAEADAMPNPIVGDATITLIEDDYSWLRCLKSVAMLQTTPGLFNAEEAL